jgi:sulfur carrier protein ThiS
MVNLMLPSYLCQLLPSDTQFQARPPRGIPIRSGSWTELIGEMRERFPGLATRVLTAQDKLASGFALIHNDEVVNADHTSLRINNGDEIAIIVSIAGG